MQDILRNLKETKHLLVLHLCNIQIQKYIANKKIIRNYAQMKYKLPVTDILRFSFSFAILFICLFVHFLPLNVRIYPTT